MPAGVRLQNGMRRTRVRSAEDKSMVIEDRVGRKALYAQGNRIINHCLAKMS
uniref:Uncharacterized protein n=1 Tax=Candidatus Kentrum eta TaxID=2126337 RepID=A0A450UMQ6_9GAMM|nr:MAG: hypothetical protein BECKH772A_GA0070896_100521 [Candidatus Kentron sp. H]VFJ93811.1 MAG: hypothetical protein BECKH772B_GA0070898_100511 [Candidatus Kentron sp. H]